MPDESVKLEKTTPFSTIFCVPDFQYAAEKRALALTTGTNLGFLAGNLEIILTPDMTFKDMVFYKKRWAVLKVLKGTLFGGLAAGVYMGTVQSASYYRGNKDDWVNHFLGGYAGFLTYSITLGKDWRYFMIGGTIWATVCTLAKLAGSSETLAATFTYRRERLGQTKYPEIFLFQETVKDIRKMKKEGLWK